MTIFLADLLVEKYGNPSHRLCPAWQPLSSRLAASSFGCVVDPGANALAAELRLSAAPGVRQPVTGSTDAHPRSPPAAAHSFTAARSCTLASSTPGRSKQS